MLAAQADAWLRRFLFWPAFPYPLPFSYPCQAREDCSCRRYYAGHPAVTVAAPDPVAQNAIVNSASQWQLTQVELEEPFIAAFQAAPSTLGVEHPPLATRFTTYQGLACNARARHSRRSREVLCAGRLLR
jgi:hypothetical protein